MPRKIRQTPWMDTRDGKFYAFWYDPTIRRTRRISLRTTDPDQAKRAFAAFLLEDADIVAPTVEGLTVAKALDDYYSEHALVKVADPTRQRDAIRHLKEFFRDTLLEQVNIAKSEGYAQARYDGLVGGGTRRKSKVGAPGTVRRELNTLVAAANHALKRERISKPIFVELPPEKRMGEDDEAPYFTQQELDSLIAAATGELKWFVQLCYLTGARRRSIENLTRAQVRWPQKRIILQQPGKRTTKKRQPIVPILKSMEEPLRELWDAGGDPRLFTCSDFYRPFKALCIDVGIDEGRAHAHVLRHTRATHLLQDGKTLYDVARLLGDTVRTVELVYGHHSHEHLAGNLEG